MSSSDRREIDVASTDEELKGDPAMQREDEARALRNRLFAATLVVLYASLIIVPHVLTCMLAKRPFNTPSYLYQRGLSIEELTSIRYGVRAINILNTVASTATVPVLSALLAQAAVTFCDKQQRSRRFAAVQLFALADRGWMNPSIQAKAFRWKGPGSKESRNFLMLATSLLLLAVIEQPLYQFLVPFHPLLVPTCAETYYMDGVDCTERIEIKKLGHDLEPYSLAHVPIGTLIPRLSVNIVNVGGTDVQNNLWADSIGHSTTSLDNTPDVSQLQTLDWYLNRKRSGGRFFATALATNTTTGTLRQHIVRFNSSVTCEQLPRSSFPTTCEGKNPFQASFKRGEDLDLQVCAPGQPDLSPWTGSRDRQDVHEDLYVSVFSQVFNVTTEIADFMVHCQSTTTRGYFELGNYRNAGLFGDLLETWPSEHELKTDYNNDQAEARSIFDRPWNDGYGSAGPLTVSAVALFGEGSFLQSTNDYAIATEPPSRTGTSVDTTPLQWQNLCDGMPFKRYFSAEGMEHRIRFPDCTSWVRYAPTNHHWDLKHLINSWVGAWNYTEQVETVLEASMFLASQALVTVEGWDNNRVSYEDYPHRIIRHGDGTMVQKPDVGTAGIIVLSVLLALQLVGLALLLCFIWTESSVARVLDAKTVVLLASGLEEKDIQLRPFPRLNTGHVSHQSDDVEDLGGASAGRSEAGRGDQAKLLQPEP